MKIADVFIKSLAVMLVAGGVSVAFLRETLYDLAMEKQAPVILVKRENKVDRNAKTVPKAIIENCQKAVLTREIADIPFLCNGIEYGCILAGETVVFYNLNQILEYDAVNGVCIKYRYECPIGEKVYAGKDLMKKAEREATEALVSKADAKIVNMWIADENDKTVTFVVVTDMKADCEILISYRLDTGSCIYFDGEEAARLLK